MATTGIKIGLLCGRENTFPTAFLQRVQRPGTGASTSPPEMVKAGRHPHE